MPVVNLTEDLARLRSSFTSAVVAADVAFAAGAGGDDGDRTWLGTALVVALAPLVGAGPAGVSDAPGEDGAAGAADADGAGIDGVVAAAVAPTTARNFQNRLDRSLLITYEQFADEEVLSSSEADRLATTESPSSPTIVGLSPKRSRSRSPKR